MNAINQIRTVMIALLLTAGMASSGQSRPEEKLGWKLGSQAYTFRMFTFFEAIDKIDSCGLKYVQGFPGQKIGGGIEGTMDYHMDAGKQKQVLQKLKSKGIAMLSYGVVSPNKEEDWVQLFKFAKAMGLQNIASEPAESDIPLVSKLADEYGINVAIHDHPNPSHYWNPDIVLKAISGQSKRLGACADVGHWVRSGLDPVECLKKLQGRIFELHVKDLNEKNNKQAHDLPWGTGVTGIEAVMKELKRQNYKGPFFAEYEYKWEHNTPEVTASAKYFREVAGKL